MMSPQRVLLSLALMSVPACDKGSEPKDTSKAKGAKGAKGAKEAKEAKGSAADSARADNPAPTADAPKAGPVERLAVTKSGLAVKDLKVEWITPKFAMTPGDQLQVSFNLESDGEVAPAVVDAKVTCMQGDNALSVWIDPKADLRKAGAALPSAEDRKIFKGTDKKAHMAPCELEFYTFGLQGMGDKPTSKQMDYYKQSVFARSCFDGKVVKEGPCEAIKKVAAAEALTVDTVTGSVVKADGEDGYYVAIQYLARIGAAMVTKSKNPAMDPVSTRAWLSCDVGGEKKEANMVGFSGGSESVSGMDPGDTKQLTAKVFYTEPVKAEPSKCTVEIREASMAERKGAVLGTYCLTAGKLADGACA